MLHQRSRFLPRLFATALTCLACGTNDKPAASETTEGKPGSVAPAPKPPTQLETEPKAAVTEVPTDLPRYEIEIDAEAQAQLEAAPWDADDVGGSFIDAEGRAFTVELNYRGAYALFNLVSAGSEARNWKVKFDVEAPFLGRREWNFNRETHLRHKLAYDSMRAAGVRVPSAEYVLLTVNGQDRGMYLRYEDPDNKAWLSAQFGSDTGDLFKAAYDLPGEPKRFALLTVLGSNDEDYFLHYNKKLNNNGEAATDFANLRGFIEQLNGTADSEFAGWLGSHFDVESFTSYLVVSNFISNWDSYPQRPKNYWLYQGPFSGRWFYIPWDMDATFQIRPNSLAPMGPEVSIFHGLERFEAAEPNSDEEGTERPLVRRMFADASYRQAYVERYRELTRTLLNEDFLDQRIDQLTALCEPNVSPSDFIEVSNHNDEIREYIAQRVRSVTRELAELP